MKKFREMNKDNKGFSLVELIVVIAIMVVLIAVLGSTILGYVDKAKYSKDMSALDSINTAMKTFVADPKSNYDDGKTYTLAELMDANVDVSKVIAPILSEVFDINNSDLANSKFNGESKAFKDVTASKVKIRIDNGAVTIKVPSADSANYADYKVGKGALS